MGRARYGFVLNTQYLVLLVLANRRIRASRRRDRLAGHDDLFANPLTPGISIIVPAYDEDLGIVDSVLAVLSLRYPQIEAVVVDDGSTDGTFPALERAFDLVEVPLDPNERIRPLERCLPRSGRQPAPSRSSGRNRGEQG